MEPGLGRRESDEAGEAGRPGREGGAGQPGRAAGRALLAGQGEAVVGLDVLHELPGGAELQFTHAAGQHQRLYR